MVVTGADRSDARAGGAAERWTTQLAGPLLLVAATAGLLGQGAYYPSTQRPVGLLIAVATLLALAGRPLARDDIRLLPVIPALALAAWAVLDGALVAGAGAGVGSALLLVGVVAVLLVCRRLRHEDREIVLAGVIGIGLLVAIARMLWRARPTGRASATWAGVVAAAAAFAVHSGFDFVWHLPAIVLTVTLLVGAVLPAPDTAPAHKPSIPVQEEEPDENQAAH